MIDLHVHSTRSDGTFSPTELVDYAISKNLTAFALTDHDSVDGLAEASVYAESLKAKGMTVPEIIPGIELSTEYQGKDIHMVGLYIDYHDPDFLKYLRDFIASREERNYKMCAKLREHGIPITYEELLAAFPGSVITRAHYARYMMEHGFIKSIAEAFERYVGDRCPCFVPREKVTPEQGIELITRAGGIPILAHPILYKLGKAHLDDLVGRLKDAGLKGIEVIYSTYDASDERQIRSLARKYDLLESGGSDFHGNNKPGLDLGVGYGKLCVPDYLLDEIKKSKVS